jgi:hypothetical protein
MALELIEVESRKVTTGGVIAAKVPAFLRNDRRSSWPCRSSKSATVALLCVSKIKHSAGDNRKLTNASVSHDEIVAGEGGRDVTFKEAVNRQV